MHGSVLRAKLAVPRYEPPKENLLVKACEQFYLDLLTVVNNKLAKQVSKDEDKDIALSFFSTRIPGEKQTYCKFPIYIPIGHLLKSRYPQGTVPTLASQTPLGEGKEEKKQLESFPRDRKERERRTIDSPYLGASLIFGFPKLVGRKMFRSLQKGRYRSSASGCGDSRLQGKRIYLGTRSTVGLQYRSTSSKKQVLKVISSDCPCFLK